MLDGDPYLLEQSYRLRYQVYCLERHYLHADDYPDHLERDAFDRYSVHVGAVDGCGELAATARLVKPNAAGLPLFRYCSLNPEVTTLERPENFVVEVSRVSISREYARHHADSRGALPASPARRYRDAEPFLTLLKSVIAGARRAGATHLIGATDAALHRRLVRFGFPYRVAGPSVDYYGLVAPHIMSLAEFDEVVRSGGYPAVTDFPVGADTAPQAMLEDESASPEVMAMAAGTL